MSWTLFLGGLLVWALHFFALYAVASIFLTSDTARLLTVAVTLLCLVLNALLFVRVASVQADVELTRWMRSLALLGVSLSVVAILWQALPAALV